MPSAKIAFIGTGIMGRPMALNLLSAGFEIFACARRKEALAPLLDAGARACASPEEAMAAADFAVTMVSDTPDVREVITGPGGLMHGARADKVIIDMTTCNPLDTREIAAELKRRDIHMLDAPVSGGDIGAINGELSIMVGGDADIYERALPIFQALGKNIVHIGAAGAGQVAKACNQVLVSQTIAATAEMLEFAQAMEVDPRRVREALLGGFAASRILEVHGARMLEEEYAPGFKAELLIKDLNIIASVLEASDFDPPGMRLARKRFQAMVDGGGGGLDCSAIKKDLRK